MQAVKLFFKFVSTSVLGASMSARDYMTSQEEKGTIPAYKKIICYYGAIKKKLTIWANIIKHWIVQAVKKWQNHSILCVLIKQLIKKWRYKWQKSAWTQVLSAKTSQRMSQSLKEDSALGSKAREKKEERGNFGHVLEMGWKIVGWLACQSICQRLLCPH